LNHGEPKIPLPVLALAFAANRADHYTRVIEPFLAAGDKRICICDRYYISSIVYQSDSMNNSDFEKILELNSEAKQPDLTIFLNTSTANSYKRLKNRQGGDRELFDKPKE
jgi:thymidylate kinase